jgi:hypothetical protein
MRPSPFSDVALDFLTLEDGTDKFSRNVGDYQSTLRNIPEEQSSHNKNEFVNSR